VLIVHYLLAFIFAFSGIGGLIFQAEIGVFVGLGLLPWQLGRAGAPRILYQVSGLFAVLAGLVYFLLAGMWFWLFAYIFISIYNIWGYFRFYGEKESSPAG